MILGFLPLLPSPESLCAVQSHHLLAQPVLFGSLLLNQGRITRNRHKQNCTIIFLMKKPPW